MQKCVARGGERAGTGRLLDHDPGANMVKIGGGVCSVDRFDQWLKHALSASPKLEIRRHIVRARRSIQSLHDHTTTMSRSGDKNGSKTCLKAIFLLASL